MAPGGRSESTGPIHRSARTSVIHPQSVHDRGADTRIPSGQAPVCRPVTGSRTRRVPPHEPSDQAAPDQVRLGDDVAVRDPPHHPPVASSASVSISLWRMTWSSRDEPRSATIGVPLSRRPAQLPGARLERVDPEAVAHRAADPGCPTGCPGLVEDERGEARGPDAERSLHPQLRPAQPIGVRRDEGAVVGERATDLAQGRDGVDAAAARPADSGAESPPGNRTFERCGSGRRAVTARVGRPRTAWHPLRWRTCGTRVVGLRERSDRRVRERCAGWREAPRTPRWRCPPPPTRPGSGPGRGPSTTRKGGCARTAGCRRSANPVGLGRLLRGRAAQARRGPSRPQPADVHAVRAADECHDRLQARSVGATNTRLFTIWPSSAPTAAAASAAVCVESSKMRMSSRHALALAASRTRWRAGCGSSGTGPSLAWRARAARLRLDSHEAATMRHST